MSVDLGYGNWAEACLTCNGTGEVDDSPLMRIIAAGEGTRLMKHCPSCGGVGFVGVNPCLPTNTLRESEARQLMYRIRAASGVSVTNPMDGPGDENDQFDDNRCGSLAWGVRPDDPKLVQSGAD